MSMFQAKPGDATEYGYNITWYHGHESEAYGYLTIPHDKVQRVLRLDIHRIRGHVSRDPNYMRP